MFILLYSLRLHLFLTKRFMILWLRTQYFFNLFLEIPLPTTSMLRLKLFIGFSTAYLALKILSKPPVSTFLLFLSLAIP